MKLRFAILLPSKINHLVAAIARRAAAQAPQEFVVDNHQLLPHITLFVINFPKNRLPNLFAQYRQDLKAKGAGPVALQISNYQSFFQVWVGLRVMKTRQLQNLRNKALQYVKTYQIKNDHRFVPHITLTKFKKRGMPRIVEKGMQPIHQAFVADTIGICRSGPHGQVHKVIYQIKLKNNK